MIYCHCTQCGCSFPKGHKKHPKCWYCGSELVREKNVTKKELSAFSMLLDEQIVDLAKKGEIKLPE